QGILRIYLKYDTGRNCAMMNIKKISKPSRRMYLKSKDIKPILSGMGISIISTSKGIMTDKRARKENLGGEILCNVW
ncbi:MAG: 30S ribosomal protein S8, partial [Thermodesulfobacteriota bacterium]